ncbi:MAG: SHIRT domain-containing protein [Lachnospiraceae bacterium]|nr:SHIRT domain-containing protein [Lachnospiraceae bacterium]
MMLILLLALNTMFAAASSASDSGPSDVVEIIERDTEQENKETPVTETPEEVLPESEAQQEPGENPEPQESRPDSTPAVSESMNESAPDVPPAVSESTNESVPDADADSAAVIPEAPVQEAESEAESVKEGIPAATYTAACSRASVTVDVPEGAFTESVSLHMTELSEGTQAYQQAEDTLAQTTSFDNMLAFDISFRNADGAEVEPAAEVQMSITINASDSEEIEEGSLQVAHIDESSGSAEAQVVAAETQGTLSVDENQVSAEFQVSSFSTFTLSWNYSGSLGINCIDISGNGIGGNSSKRITESSDVSSIAPTFNGFSFLKAVYANSTAEAANGTEISALRYQNNRWNFLRKDNNQWYRWSSGGIYFIYDRVVTFSPSISHASVLYYHYTSETDLSGFSFDDFQSMSDGNNIVGTYQTNVRNYWVFFVKPEDNYMLSGMATSGSGGQTAGWIYDFTGGNYGTNNYPGIQTIGNVAKENGYIAIFGYSRGVNAAITANPITFTITGTQPTISVTASANPASGVIPGETVTFEATITPGSVTGSNASVKKDGVVLNSITINGNEITEVYTDAACTNKVSVSELRASGPVTVYIPYVTTDADFVNNGEVTLEADATVTYQTQLVKRNSNGTTSTFTTESVITGSGQTSVSIAPSEKLIYTFDYDPNNLTRPEGFPVPPETVDVYQGQTVTLASNSYDDVQDEANGGYWSFDGWYDTKEPGTKLGSTIKITDTTAKILIGHWKFHQTVMTLQISKEVTGNMGDRSKSFSFTLTDKDGKTIREFTLADGNTVNIEKLPLGSKLVLTESNADGYKTSVIYGGEEISPTERNGKSFEITPESGKTELAVTNHKEAIPETGIYTTGAAPYLMLLGILTAFVLTAAINAFRRRREV